MAMQMPTEIEIQECVCAAKAEAARISAACQPDFKASPVSFRRRVFADVCVQWRQHPASSCLLSLSKCQPHLPQQSDKLKAGERKTCGIDRKPSNTKLSRRRCRVSAGLPEYTDVRRGCSHSVACLCYRTHTLCLSWTWWRGKVLKCANLLPLWLPHVSTVTFRCNKFPPIKQRVANPFHYELMGDIMGMVLLL